MDLSPEGGWPSSGSPPVIHGVVVDMTPCLKLLTMNKYFEILLIVLVMIAGSTHTGFAQDENNFEISKNVEIYVDVMRQLNVNYADKINPGELSKTAIDAMLNKLDPYTVYIPESQLEDFDLMTRGEYGGIGALIQRQGDVVYITEPYEGFPAQKSGLVAGDQIMAIDGESTEGKTSTEISERLKGSPGTELTISIKRYGDTIQVDVPVVREKVKIPNIPFYGMLDDGVGYIGLTQFNPSAATEIKKAFVELQKNENLSAIVIDLRGNGGGLLSEAVDICNIFVPKGQVIVTTKGKLSERLQAHKTRYAAIDTKIPLAILVDDQSASASEIVAGAIQDLDRGIVVGQKTFGKGLVQNVLQLPYNSKLKVTVAKYYIPSGRCIQAIDYFSENGNSGSEKVPDSLITAFKTKGGRLVYDGGGIIPDVTMESRHFSQITADLFANNYIFKFVNGFVAENESIASPSEFYISDSVYADFKKFVENKSFSYKTETEALIERLKGSAERESYIEAISDKIELLEEEIKTEKKHDIDKHKAEIKELLRVEIVTRYHYQKGKIETALRNDPDIIEVLKILKDNQRMESLLTASKIGG